MCGSKTQTTKQKQEPAKEAMSFYRDLIKRFEGLGETPYNQYYGERVAPFTPAQEQAMQTIKNLQGAGAGTLQGAIRSAERAGAPITAEDIERYQNPYQKAVVDAMSAQMRQQEAEDISKLQGTSISSGAFGGDRAKVAQAQLMSNQERERNARISDLLYKGWSSSQAAAQAEKEMASRASQQLQSLAGSEYELPARQAMALYGTGEKQQALEQAKLEVPYQYFQEKRSYPFQLAQYLAGMGTAVGSQMGGTSTTTQPGPSPWSQILGAGLSFGLAPVTGGGSLMGNFFGGNPTRSSSTGGRINKEEGGGLGQTAMFQKGYIPTVDPVKGAGAPGYPAPAKQDNTLDDIVDKAMSLAKKMKEKPEETTTGWESTITPSYEPTPLPGTSFMSGDVVPPSITSPSEAFFAMPVNYAYGGGINRPHYDNGGGTEYDMSNLIDLMAKKTPDVIGSSEGLRKYERAGFESPIIEPPSYSTGDISEIMNKNIEADKAPIETGETKAELPPIEVQSGKGPASGFTKLYGEGTEGGVSEKGKSLIGGLLGLSPEAEQAGMAAGLAMMAGQSPFALSNIGAGGMSGMKYYNELMKEKQEQALKEKEIAGKDKKRTPTKDVTEDGDRVYLDEDGNLVYNDGKPIPPDKETMTEPTFKEMKKGQSAEKEQKQKARSAYRAFHQQTKQIEDQIDQVANSLSPWSTGLAGKFLKDIPETEANQIKEYLENLKILIGLEKLQEFKQLSTTGASGFGSLTENEFLRLMNSQGSLSQNLPIDKLVTELNKVRNIVARMKYNYDIDYEERYGSENKPELKDFSLSNEEFMKQARSRFAPDQAPTMTATPAPSEEAPASTPVHPNYLGTDTVTSGGRTYQWDRSINDYSLKE